ncbi:MAG: hypothetical protein ACJARD_000173 [Alphaproteobacteria bacterium]|jgi:hypothetical protein
MGIGQNVATIQQAANYAVGATQVAAQTSLYEARTAYEMALMEARGQQATLQIQQITTAVNVRVDLESLAAKNAQLLAGKAMESYTMIAQTREKMLGLFTSITQQRSSTAWNNMKQMTQAFKF